MRLLQQTVDDKRTELLRAEAKLRETEERFYTTSVNVSDKVKDDLRVISFPSMYHLVFSRFLGLLLSCITCIIRQSRQCNGSLKLTPDSCACTGATIRQQLERCPPTFGTL